VFVLINQTSICDDSIIFDAQLARDGRIIRCCWRCCIDYQQRNIALRDNINNNNERNIALNERELLRRLPIETYLKDARANR